MRRCRVPPAPESIAIETLVRPDGSPARDATRVRLAHGGGILEVSFACDDRDVWSTLSRRDDPLWQEECVEVFLAPGEADPALYFEFEASPAGVLFDARVSNPLSRRDDLSVDATWDCPGIVVRAAATATGWGATLRIPLAPLSDGPPPRIWRANVYRIERPRGEPAEFSCWSPTHTDPADFHKPERFGFLELSDLRGAPPPAPPGKAPILPTAGSRPGRRRPPS